MYLPAEHPAFTRHFVDLGDRQVHFRLAGAGPPLLLLHQSPTSSAEMATEIEAFAHHFTVIAVDTPGCGLSDSLPDERPELGQFAEALDEFVAALELDRFLIYGYHTGAIIGFEYARRYPHKCAGAVVNGLAVLEGTELEDMLEHYNVVPAPVPDGGHLQWAWARLRDQKLFFPWYRREPAARLALDLSDGEALHPYLLDFLRAEDGGRKPYQAALAYPSRDRMPGLQAPVYLVNIAPDPLTPHPERLDGFPGCVERRIFTDPVVMRERMLAFLLRHAAIPDVEIPRQSVGSYAGLLRKDVVNTEAGPVFVRMSDPGPGTTVVILHDAGASSRRWVPTATQLARDWGGQRRVILLDLPGHGETCARQLPRFSASAIAILFDKVMQAVDAGPIELIAEGAACIIAAAIGNAHPESVRRLVLIDPWLFDRAECDSLVSDFVPDLAARDYGQHLAEAWYFIRDGELFWPWNAPRATHALTRTPDIEPDEVTERVVDLLLASRVLPRFVAELLRSDLSAALATLPMPVDCCARTGGAHEHRAELTARMAPLGAYNALPADRQRWAAEIVQMLKDRH